MIRHQGPWKHPEDIEFGALEWVDWFNHRRLFEAIGYVPPSESEEEYYRQTAQREEEELKEESLH